MTMNPTESDTGKPERDEPSGAGSFLLPRLINARVEDAMHPGVITVSADTGLREVARLLAGGHIHSVVVTGSSDDSASARWGLMSSVELVRAAIDSAPSNFEERTAGELALDAPATVSTADRLDRAAQLMVERESEHLIVVSAEDGQPVGVLSTLDIAGVMAWGEA